MTFSNFRDIADLWPDRMSFAIAVGAPYPTVVGMILRDSMPACYFDAVVNGAAEIGHPEVTHELLCKIAAAKRQQR